MQTHDYLRPVDLNPTVNGAAAPVMMATDPRALHMFGFTAAGQHVQNLSAYRVLVSFDYDYSQMPLPSAPGPLKVHRVLDPGASLAYEQHHDRGHVIVWLDPGQALPGQGIAVDVRVSAWA